MSFPRNIRLYRSTDTVIPGFYRLSRMSAAALRREARYARKLSDAIYKFARGRELRRAA